MALTPHTTLACPTNQGALRLLTLQPATKQALTVPTKSDTDRTTCPEMSRRLLAIQQTTHTCACMHAWAFLPPSPPATPGYARLRRFFQSRPMACFTNEYETCILLNVGRTRAEGTT
jgi:hypothetical protein